MGTIRNFKDLIAWQKGMDLAVEVYQGSRAFPVDERFGLTAQVRKAAVSVPCNVAEGFGRSSRADFLHFLGIARGSANEVETQILLALRLQFLEKDASDAVLEGVHEEQRILAGLTSSLDQAERRTVRE